MLYEIEDRLYVALTERCPAACRFCVKKAWGMQFRGADLSVAKEPEAGEVIDALNARLDRGGVREVVFCGFGECTYRLDALSAAGLHLRLHRPGIRVRLNTIGLGNLIWKRDITKLLALSLHEVSVSLNTADPDQWVDMHRPAPAMREQGFESVLAFTSGCVAAGLSARVTAISQPRVDLDRVQELAASLGASFLPRPPL